MKVLNFKKIGILFLAIGFAVVGCKKEPIVTGGKTQEQSVRGFSQNENGEEIIMPNNVIFVKEDINSKINSIDENGNLHVQASDVFNDVKIGDILYSLPTEKFPDGYALKIVENTNYNAPRKISTKNTESEILYCTEPATIEEVFAKYQCSVQYSANINPDNIVVYDIADQENEPLNSGLFGNFDLSFDMKSKLDVWNGKARTTNPSNSRLKKIRITDKSATLTYVIFDKDDNLLTDNDQVLLDLVVEYDLSNMNVFANAESGTFAIDGVHTWKVEGTISYSPDKDFTESDRKAFERKMKEKMLGKKFTIVSIPLTPASATNLIIKPSFDIFYELTADIEGKIKVTGGVKDYQYSFALFASAALGEVQKNIHVIKNGTFYADFQAAASIDVGLAFGMGLTAEIPAFRMFETRKKSYFGLYADYGVDAHLNAALSGSTETGKTCFKFNIDYEAEPSVYAEYSINFTKKYSYSGKIAYPFHDLQISGTVAEYEHCWETDSTPPTPAEGVLINGVIWAKTNVDAPGTFAANPEDAGMFYQWNRKKAWNVTEYSVTGWDNSNPEGDVWTKENDPSPTGYRIPTNEELETLCDVNMVSREWLNKNGINGIKFTDRNNGNNIFLPAAGNRYGDVSWLDNVGVSGGYWSSTGYGVNYAYVLSFDNSGILYNHYYRTVGWSVRCVTE